MSSGSKRNYCPITHIIDVIILYYNYSLFANYNIIAQTSKQIKKATLLYGRIFIAKIHVNYKTVEVGCK